MLLVDINAFVRYDSHLGLLYLYKNIVTTGLGSWGIFSVLLILLCFLGMKQAVGRYWKKRKESGIEDTTQEEQDRSQRAVNRIKASFLLYLKVVVIGLVVWGILFVIYLFL